MLAIHFITVSGGVKGRNFKAQKECICSHKKITWLSKVFGIPKLFQYLPLKVNEDVDNYSGSGKVLV